jgi:hypothetical protein
VKCIVCEKPIPESEHVCSPECYREWDGLQAEAERDMEAADRERWEDPNAGCWSFTW